MATLKSYESNAKITNGVLFISNRKLFDKALLTIGDCDCEIKVSKKFRKRTSPQNRYYWSVIVQYWMDLLSNSQGEIYTKAQTHEFLKSNFNFKEIVSEVTGEVLRMPKSTTENRTFEMEEFHEVCRQKSLEFFNVVIPLPNEQLTAFE
jgi:hypothetical protein